MELYGLSDRGRVRENNEDMLRLEPELDALVLADGMGGERCGEVASAVAVEAASRALHSGAGVVAAVREANTAVWQRSRQECGCRGMGTTLVVMRREGDRLEIASVGDSRAYVFREGSLRQLTEDQTVYQQLRSTMGLSHEEALRYPNARALTAAVGVAPEVALRTYQEPLAAGDMVMACSDGLYGPVPLFEMTALLARNDDLANLAGSLVNAANAHGGPDNITLGLMLVKR